MKKQVLLGLGVGVAALGATVFAGQEHDATKPQMFTIYKEVVAPAKTEEYETAIKHMISEFAAYNIDPEKVHFTTISGPEIGYIYVMPIDNYAAMDTMHANWEEAIEIIGKDKFEDIVAEADEAIDHVDTFQVMLRPDLSYEPEKPRLQPGEAKYVSYGFYYALPGKKDEIEKIAKQFVELYKKNNIDAGWRVYQSISGSDLPLYVVAHPAKSEADFYKDKARIDALIGDQADKLGHKVMTTIRKMEQKEGWLRPDLSYPAPEMTGRTGH